MPKTATSLPPDLLQQIYAEVEARFDRKYSSRIEELESRIKELEAKCDQLEKEADLWKKKYFFEQKRAQGLQGKLELAQVKIKELEALCERQRVQIERLQQQIHGKKPDALPLLAPPVDEPKRKRGKQTGSKGNGRKSRIEIEPEECIHDFLPEERLCATCGAPFEDISEKSSEEIHIEYKLVRRIHRRKTVRKTCTCPLTATVKTAPAPPKLFKGSGYSVAIWSTVIFEKYHLQRPLNRVLQWFESLGLKDVSQGTLTNGLKRLYENRVFEALYEDIRQRVSAAKHQQKDETGWKVFQETEGKKGFGWFLMVTLGNNCTFFELEPTRSREIAKHTIGDNPVVLSSDCLSIYHNMGDNVTNAWCWAHIRRALLEMARYKGLTAMSLSWVQKVDHIYHLNNQRINASSDAEFQIHDLALRTALSEFERQAKRNAKREGMHKEAHTVFCRIADHWKGLTVFLNMPAIPMDNNASERAIRNPICGRKGYYGSGAHWSGRLAAQLFSIFATLQQNGINPRSWLTEYLQAVAQNGGQPPSNSVSYLPWNSPDSTLLL